MNCPKCGASILPSESFCRTCGSANLTIETPKEIVKTGKFFNNVDIVNPDTQDEELEILDVNVEERFDDQIPIMVSDDNIIPNRSDDLGGNE